MCNVELATLYFLMTTFHLLWLFNYVLGFPYIQSVINMSIGEVAKIHCSPDYAYGAGGFPAWGIMPNSELVSSASSSIYGYWSREKGILVSLTYVTYCLFTKSKGVRNWSPKVRLNNLLRRGGLVCIVWEIARLDFCIQVLPGYHVVVAFHRIVDISEARVKVLPSPTTSWVRPRI